MGSYKLFFKYIFFLQWQTFKKKGDNSPEFSKQCHNALAVKALKTQQDQIIYIKIYFAVLWRSIISNSYKIEIINSIAEEEAFLNNILIYCSSGFINSNVIVLY